MSNLERIFRMPFSLSSGRSGVSIGKFPQEEWVLLVFPLFSVSKALSKRIPELLVRTIELENLEITDLA